MVNGSLADSGIDTGSPTSFKELMIREYGPFRETGKDWKSDSDKSLGKDWFDGLYELFIEEGIIPSLEEAVNGFDLLAISANNGSIPIYIADRLYRELLQQGLEPDNVRVHINDIVTEQIEDTRRLLFYGEYVLFGEEYSRNPLLRFSSQNAYEPDFNGQQFDVIMDLKGALWYAALSDRVKDGRKSVPETIDIYYNLLNMGGCIVLDDYGTYSVDTIDRMLLHGGYSAILRDGGGHLELRPDYAERFEIREISGEHPTLRFVVLKKVS